MFYSSSEVKSDTTGRRKLSPIPNTQSIPIKRFCSNPLWGFLALLLFLFLALAFVEMDVSNRHQHDYRQSALRMKRDANFSQTKVPEYLMKTQPCPTGASILGCNLCGINKGPRTSGAALHDYSLADKIVKTDATEAFDKIYRERIWGDAGEGSGLGSTIENAEGATYALRIVLYKYAVTKIIDAPCGALSWTESFVRQMRSEIPCFEYAGVDIVPSVIESNRQKFKDSEYTKFYVRDISDPLQSLPTNNHLILSRDSLQHLPMALIKTALRNYCASNSTFLLVGSYISAKRNKNRNIVIGNAFSINLLLPPFSFPPPIEIFNERTKDGKFLLLWRLKDLCESVQFKTFVSSSLTIKSESESYTEI